MQEKSIMARPEQVFHMRDRERELGFAFAVKSAGFLHVAGTCAQDGEGNPFGVGDMEAQLRRIYEDIETALHAHGLAFEHVVREVIYVTDIDAFRAALPARKHIYANAGPPACTWVEVSRLMRPEYLIEIEVTAELPS
jgi:enamine deaminase RidA (YjgF/YER057c/UK114 family)